MEHRVKKVKIFSGSYLYVENTINKWLEENKKKIECVGYYAPTSSSDSNITVMISYEYWDD